MNDSSTNDEDKLEIYAHQQAATASSSIKKPEYNVHLFVFSKNDNEWSCSTCTYLNTYDAENCHICQSKRDESSINFQFKDSLEFKIFNEQVFRVIYN